MRRAGVPPAVTAASRRPLTDSDRHLVPLPPPINRSDRVPADRKRPLLVDALPIDAPGGLFGSPQPQRLEFTAKRGVDEVGRAVGRIRDEPWRRGRRHYGRRDAGATLVPIRTK